LNLVHNSVFHSVVYLTSKRCVCITFSFSDLRYLYRLLLVTLLDSLAPAQPQVNQGVRSGPMNQRANWHEAPAAGAPGVI
jgi:hypothetical protein